MYQCILYIVMLIINLCIKLLLNILQGFAILQSMLAMHYWCTCTWKSLINFDMLWSLHVNSICSKANRLIGFLQRNLRHCPTRLQETTLYVTMPGALCLNMGLYSSKFDLPTGKSATQSSMVCPWSKSSCDSTSQILNTLHWISLELEEKSHLLLLFKAL